MTSIVILTYNRLNILRNCISAIKRFTFDPHEIIVVNNASTDGTREFLDSIQSPSLIPIHCPQNFGVTARNFGFDRATGDFIAQIDDDVEVLPGWDTKCLEVFARDSSIGLVGQQGGLIKTWMDVHSHVHQTRDGYVDYMTGFCMMMRNVGLRYDEAFAPFWHEELMYSLDMKALGYRLYRIDGLCIHHSARTTLVDWEVHDRNLKRCYDKYKDKIAELNLEGMKNDS
jgi:glycosyltransferase involved in cell wall biosynthesis